MITDLFVAASGITSENVARAIPPACRRDPSAPPRITASPRELIFEFDAWRPRAASRHLAPSFSMVTDVPYVLRFEVSARARGRWSPWVATVTIGPGMFTDLPASADPLTCDVDVYTASLPLEEVRFRIRLGAPDAEALAAAPWMATLSACDLTPTETPATTIAVPRMPVPALSQLDPPSDVAMRICSPTSVAMVLGYWGTAVSPADVAADVFHPPTDRYGVWPAAVRAAGLHGVAGYVLRFPDWASAAWCLEHALPIIASIGYGADELYGAPLRETSGHLVVLTGCDATHAFVNDPVAPTVAEVPRRYRLDELRRAWLERSGVGYVLFMPGRDLEVREALSVRG
jgi:Peptidase_C39 like family